MTVTTQTHDHVATVTFARPPHNFADLALIEAIGAAFAAADADPDVRVILLRSEGRVFCAGADLVNANPVAGGVTPERNPFYVAAARLFGTGKPVIAQVQGAAVGAGLGLALVADFRVAAPEARFAANFTKLGFHPGFGLTYTLPRLIGRQNAAMMFLTGERYDASEALEMGLIDDLVDLPRERLLEPDRRRGIAAEKLDRAGLPQLPPVLAIRSGAVADIERHDVEREGEERGGGDHTGLRMASRDGFRDLPSGS